ncbi:GNAT family N-acetyltransferase [Miniphocaeibacter massiliensis]|uniref:GNAT family N-acetyltransferase n=1 Tax=Miniphocaeibacter massiliensis TaxID=2041841 RepID=UPI000C1B87C5|nr:GNAT family N-acetyltransferase [Miniphocaeibacter massiliensis]
MEFRKTKLKDIDQILEIYRQGSESLKRDGVDQWQNEKPDTKTLMTDIEMEESYVLVEDNNVKGTAAVIFGGEKTYDLIFNGMWFNDEEYCTIHRLAVSEESKRKGLAKAMMDEIEKLCKSKGIYSIRIDTHEDNVKMRNFLERSGFFYCGKIFLRSGDLRVAYQKEL